MHREDVQMTRRDERRPSRRGILLVLLPLTLLAAALAAPPAVADPQTDSETNCRVVLTTTSNTATEATLNFTNCDFDVEQVKFGTNNTVLVGPPPTFVGPGGNDDTLLCPVFAGTSFTCTGGPINAVEAGESASATLNSNDPVCGDGTPRLAVEDLELSGTRQPETPVTVTFPNDLLVQGCAPPGGTTPTTPTTQPQAVGQPGGTGGGGFDGGGGGGFDGGGGVAGVEDSGQVPAGGVQSGAGGTAPADDGAGLLAAVVGLMLAATLGLGIARVRSVRE